MAVAVVGATATSRIVANNVCFQVRAEVTPMADMSALLTGRIETGNCRPLVAKEEADLPPPRLNVAPGP